MGPARQERRAHAWRSTLQLPKERRTKIVATIGPASRAPDRIRALIQAGVDVFRLNFSHGSIAEHEQAIVTIRAAARETDRAIGILQDLSGPKIRTGRLAGGGPVELVAGRPFTITTDDVDGTAELVSTSYTALPRDVTHGDTILLADGALELRVVDTDSTRVTTTVVRGGQLGQSKGINLPGIAVSAPALTAKDERDLAFGISAGVDFVALSFVRSPADVHLATAFIKERGGDIPVIAKLERPEAVAQLEAILVASGGVMVARGDLGVEVPPEYVPPLQKRMIAEANRHALPVITATQMLESMISSPRPTRAEASDVANAIFDGTDAVMLSGETAIGQYPIETVQIMDRIARAAEATAPAPEVTAADLGQEHAITRAARQLAEDLRVQAIVVFTQSGRTAELLSNDHPAVPVIALTPRETIFRRLALRWGIEPVLSELAEDSDATIALMEHALTARSILKPGDQIVVVGSTPVAARARTNFIKLHTVRNGDARL